MVMTIGPVHHAVNGFEKVRKKSTLFSIGNTKVCTVVLARINCGLCVDDIKACTRHQPSAWQEG
jgi:hypothetical protein